MLPFPSFEKTTNIASQSKCYDKLEKARMKASRGLLISLGKDLQSSDKFIRKNCVQMVTDCFGEDIGSRVMKNYVILMFFIQKVSILRFVKNSLLAAGITYLTNARLTIIRQTKQLHLIPTPC